MKASSKLSSLQEMSLALSFMRHVLSENRISGADYANACRQSHDYLSAHFAMADRLETMGEDWDEKEAYALCHHLKVVARHKNSTCFQGGDFDLYLDLQNPGNFTPSQSGWGVL